MLDVIRKIISDVLNTIYQQFWSAIFFTILIMFLYMYAKEKGWKSVFKQWVDNFKQDKMFRKYFLLVFYSVMIMIRTLLNRSMWKYPLSDVIGTWGLYYTDGTISIETILNLVLFVPFAYLWAWCAHEKRFGYDIKLGYFIWLVLKTSFLFSFSIEFLQLFLQLGTFQLSDIFYNTLGGVLGGFIYCIVYKIKTRKK